MYCDVARRHSSSLALLPVPKRMNVKKNDRANCKRIRKLGEETIKAQLSAGKSSMIPYKRKSLLRTTVPSHWPVVTAKSLRHSIWEPFICVPHENKMQCVTAQSLAKTDCIQCSGSYSKANSITAFFPDFADARMDRVISIRLSGLHLIRCRQRDMIITRPRPYGAIKGRVPGCV